MKSISSIQILLALLILAISSGAGAATISWGALATSVVGDCDGLGNCTFNTAEDADGGSSTASASSQITDPRGNSTANATLSGIALTPNLSVFADSLGDPTQDPDLVQSSASGIQAYTNLDIARTITLDLQLTTGPQGVVGNPASVLATVSVFKSLVAPELTFSGDTFEDLLIDPVLLSGMSAPPLIALPGLTSPPTIFEFDVAANEHFLILASLVAQAGNGGVADASSTLTIDLREGNQALGPDELRIASQSTGVIPLPAGVWLFLTGVGLVGGLSWRHKGRATS